MSHSLLIALLSLCCFSNEISGTQPEALINTYSVKCNGGSDGKIIIQIADTTQVYTAQLFKYSPTGMPVEAQQVNDTTNFIISDLDAGKYFVEIKGNWGFSLAQSIEVVQPDKLETGKIAIDKKLSADESSDARLKAMPEGGTLPYTFQWNIEGESKLSQVIENIKQGMYTCIINDANNCGPVKASIIFNKHVIPNIVEE